MLICILRYNRCFYRITVCFLYSNFKGGLSIALYRFKLLIRNVSGFKKTSVHITQQLHRIFGSTLSQYNQYFESRKNVSCIYDVYASSLKFLKPLDENIDNCYQIFQYLNFTHSPTDID